MVVFVDGKKYACNSCIRGHRVAKCNHKDRPLVAIIKRGRQITQCNHCRDLRKTNKSHVKCTCAITITPNPINGCLCEIIKQCSCVAGHLQDMEGDDSSSLNLTTLDNSLITLTDLSPAPSSCCSLEQKTLNTSTLDDPINSVLEKPPNTTVPYPPIAINQEAKGLVDFLMKDLNQPLN